MVATLHWKEYEATTVEEREEYNENKYYIRRSF